MRCYRYEKLVLYVLHSVDVPLTPLSGEGGQIT